MINEIRLRVKYVKKNIERENFGSYQNFNGLAAKNYGLLTFAVLKKAR